MATVLESVFSLKPDLKRFAEMLADEGRSGEYITRSLNDVGVKISQFPVKAWLKEYRKTRSDTPTEENDPHDNNPSTT